MYHTIIIVGNLGRDPEMRYTSGGSAVTSLSVAVTRNWKNSNGEKQTETTWLRCSAWNKLAESCHQRLRKGSAVLIEGELQSRNWKTDDGGYRSILEVKARRIQFLNKTARTNGNGFDAFTDEEGDVFTECDEEPMFELFENSDETMFTFDSSTYTDFRKE